MEINSTLNSGFVTSAMNTKTTTTSTENKNNTDTAQTSMDTNVSYVIDSSKEVVSSSSKSNSTYDYISKSDVDALIKESNQQSEAFAKMLHKLLQQQADKNAIAFGTSSDNEYYSLLGNIADGKNVMVEVDDATRAEAKELVSEDGYFGVKQTSERILDFAKALSGGDASKFETLKKATLDGFKAAEEVWGGEMPQITKDTYDAVMAGFDAWEKELNGN